MAEFLKYNKVHWMDVLTQKQIDEYVAKHSDFMDKYNARTQWDDVVEVQPNGYWTGPKAKKFRADTFSVVVVSDLDIKDAKQYQKPLVETAGTIAGIPVYKIIRKCRYSISNSVDVGKVLILPSVSQLSIADKESIIG